MAGRHDEVISTIRREAKKPLSRRFYETASLLGEDASYGVALDGKPLRTPLKAPFLLPTRALGAAVVAEWQAQGPAIDPSMLPMTKLANTAIDRVVPDRHRIIEEIVQFAGCDLVCYRASAPERLRARQAERWDPVLAWAEHVLAAEFLVSSDIVFRDQPAATLNAIRGFLLPKSAWELTALHNLTTLTGSALLAVMVGAGAMSGDEAWSTAHLDEDWQIEHWGVDAEAEALRASHRRDFDAALMFLGLLG